MSNDAERITLPSGASYPSAILPLTSQEQSLLDTYASIKSHEKEASRLKAEEAKRRLEEADERYRAKIKERGDAEDVTTVVEEEDSEDEESKRRRIQREREISQLRRDVEAARTAKQDEETKQKAKREKEEALRKQLLGEPSSTAAVQKKRPHVDNEDEDFESDQDYQETTTTTFVWLEDTLSGSFTVSFDFDDCGRGSNGVNYFMQPQFSDRYLFSRDIHCVLESVVLFTLIESMSTLLA
jgi:hypothetical protein